MKLSFKFIMHPYDSALTFKCHATSNLSYEISHKMKRHKEMYTSII